MQSHTTRIKSVKMIAAYAAGLAMGVVLFAAGSAMADEGVVERTDVCHKGTLIIKTADNAYVAATRNDSDNENFGPSADNDTPRCAFYSGDRVRGDLSGAGIVTLTNSSGTACDYVIQGSGFTMQDAEQILGCE
jgi:hypothetical protein